MKEWRGITVHHQCSHPGCQTVAHFGPCSGACPPPWYDPECKMDLARRKECETWLSNESVPASHPPAGSTLAQTGVSPPKEPS